MFIWNLYSFIFIRQKRRQDRSVELNIARYQELYAQLNSLQSRWEMQRCLSESDPSRMLVLKAKRVQPHYWGQASSQRVNTPTKSSLDPVFYTETVVSSIYSCTARLTTESLNLYSKIGPSNTESDGGIPSTHQYWPLFKGIFH